MQFSTTGTVRQTVQMMKLEMKWQKRKYDPNMPKGFGEEDPQITQLKKDAEEIRKGNIIAGLDGKLKSGGVLTDDELNYLKENNPDLYQKAMEIKKEREQYKKELTQCKTKDDVEKLKAQKLQVFLTETRAICTNPNIPESKKEELMEQITRRLMGIQSDHCTFIKSKEYAALPRQEDLDEDKKTRKKQQTQENPDEKKLELQQVADDATEELLRNLKKELEESEGGIAADGTYKTAAPENTVASKNTTRSEPIVGTYDASGNRTAPAQSADYSTGFLSERV